MASPDEILDSTPRDDGRYQRSLRFWIDQHPERKLIDQVFDRYIERVAKGERYSIERLHKALVDRFGCSMHKSTVRNYLIDRRGEMASGKRGARGKRKR